MAYCIIPFDVFFVLELCMYWIFFYVQINGYIAQITQVFYDHQINSFDADLKYFQQHLR